MIQRKEVYENHLKYDFHKNEVKSYQMIEDLLQKNQYKCYGFFENQVQKGYAYFVKSANEAVVLLDYLVVYDSFRNQGIGTAVLALIQEKLKENHLFLLAEVENPKFARSCQMKELQERRVSFYQRNGFIKTKILSQIFDDNYAIMCLPLKKSVSNDTVYRALNHIYTSIFGEAFVKKNTNVELLV